MLLEFGGKNFYSFKEGFEINLRLGKSCPDDISHGKNFVDILAVKGANASGKTNVIKALDFLNNFVPNSFSAIKPDEEITIYPYFDNNKPISLYAIFLDNGVEYKYEVDLTRERIICERIERKDKRRTTVIERKGDKIEAISDFKELETIPINRQNASIISIAHQYNIKCIEPVYHFFDNIWTNVYSFGRHDNAEVLPNHEAVSKIYYDNPDMLKFVVDFLQKSDTGIDDIKILTEKDNKKTTHYPIFDYKVDKREEFLTFHSQSDGVKLLYIQLGLYFFALDSGSLLALDEFDIHLHPDLLPLLLDLFANKKTNPKDAQLILTTHSSDIMDKLGKYKTVLVNKTDNQSFLYRLDEITGDIIRNDRAISPIYLAGKIGGVPKIAQNG